MAMPMTTDLERAEGPTGIRGALARSALLPLRLFLGGTFVYAGLDKLTDPGFLTGTGPGSLTAMLEGVRETAGAQWMVDLALKSPEGFGYAIAFGEIAVGAGALVGLLTRLAALGGALISLSFWLTVTWSTEPYYYGNDLAYLMAWTPLLLAGAGRLSLDSALSGRRRRRGRALYG
ncbi:DoxX family protein [Streptomyces sp. RKND-216]|nr:DoxX family protein [Streptomyces sp. RKND-216]